MTVDPYCYDNGTLRNRFGIRDADELGAVEHEISAVRIAEIAPASGDGSPPAGCAAATRCWPG